MTNRTLDAEEEADVTRVVRAGSASSVRSPRSTWLARLSPARWRPGTLVGAPFAILLLAGTAVPLIEVVRRLRDADSGFFALVRSTFGESAVIQALEHTVVLGVVCGVVSTALATGLALLVYRTNLPGRNVLRVLLPISFFVPVIVTSVAWYLLSAPHSGLINRFFVYLGFHHTISLTNMSGIALVLCFSFTPIAFIFIRSAVAAPDAAQEEAATIAGASGLRVIFGVTLPRILPSLGATALLMFIFVCGNFSVVGVLGTPFRIETLTTQIYVALHGITIDYAEVALIACILVVLLLVPLWFQLRLERRARVVLDSSTSGREPISWDLGRWKWPLVAVCWLYLLVVLVLPIFAVVLSSLLPYWGAPFSSASFDNVRALWNASAGDGGTFGHTIYNTIVLVGVGSTIAIIIGTVCAYAFQRLRPPGARIIDAICTGSIAIPAVVVGLGYLFVSIQTPFYDTLTLMIIVVIVHFVPIAIRLVSTSLTRVSKSLDDAARVAGAREWRVSCNIVLPQTLGEVLSGWILMILLFSHEVEGIVLVSGPGNGVLATDIYNFKAGGYPSLAAAASLFLVALTIGLLCVFGVLVAMLSRRRGNARSA